MRTCQTSYREEHDPQDVRLLLKNIQYRRRVCFKCNFVVAPYDSCLASIYLVCYVTSLYPNPVLQLIICAIKIQKHWNKKILTDFNLLSHLSFSLVKGLSITGSVPVLNKKIKYKRNIIHTSEY